MPVSFTTVDTTKLVDSPFSKMSSFMSLNANFLGLPVASNQGNLETADLYRRCAEVLSLSGPEAEYTASRIRHLDFVARTSSLASRMNWRSMLKNTWNEQRIYDKSTGFSVVNNSTKFLLSFVNLNTIPDLRLLWTFNLVATYQAPSLSNFNIFDDDSFITDVLVPTGSYKTVTLSNSGYMLGIQNNLTNQASYNNATAKITIKQPYIGNIVDIKNNIIQNPDLLLQLTANSPDLYKYLSADNMPEDVIAAFLLAIDSI